LGAHPWLRGTIFPSKPVNLPGPGLYGSNKSRVKTRSHSFDPWAVVVLQPEDQPPSVIDCEEGKNISKKITPGRASKRVGKSTFMSQSSGGRQCDLASVALLINFVNPARLGEQAGRRRELATTWPVPWETLAPSSSFPPCYRYRLETNLLPVLTRKAFIRHFFDGILEGPFWQGPFLILLGGRRLQ